MRTLVVVENVQRWSLAIEGAEVIRARDYLVDQRYAEPRPTAVYNLCRRYSYQSVGYYVSLLGAARGHRPLPSVATLQSIRLAPVLRIVSDELDGRIQRALAPLRASEFHLSIYFGRNLARRYDRLSRALFNEFPAPLLRARFSRDGGGRWTLTGIRPVATSEIPGAHWNFIREQACRYFRRPSYGGGPPREFRYDLAILRKEDDPRPPSDERAIRRFIRAAAECGIRAEVIGPEDAGRIAEYDALFLRETTAVEHHTYRLARRAAREGLVVIDDPESIVRCTNKVYQAELFRRHGLPTPDTLVVHEGNVDRIPEAVGFPCVLKQPDGSFSDGVVRVDSPEQLAALLPPLLRDSELVVAQAWTPSSFDWRIGILGDRILFACRYHMAPGHWQIVRAGGKGAARFGRVEGVPLEEVSEGVLRVARTAARLIGTGLYGVDVKEVNGRPLLMEVNDNPNLDAGQEDAVPGDGLYTEVMTYFRRALDARGRPCPGAEPNR